MRNVVEIVGNRKRLSDFCRLRIPAVRRIIESGGNRSSSIVARRNDRQQITEAVIGVGGRGCASTGIRLWLRNRLNEPARFVLSSVSYWMETFQVCKLFSCQLIGSAS